MSSRFILAKTKVKNMTSMLTRKGVKAEEGASMGDMSGGKSGWSTRERGTMAIQTSS